MERFVFRWGRDISTVIFQPSWLRLRRSKLTRSLEDKPQNPPGDQTVSEKKETTKFLNVSFVDLGNKYSFGIFILLRVGLVRYQIKLNVAFSSVLFNLNAISFAYSKLNEIKPFC